jgi:cytochrome d ubiquinol oxidase subunit II
MNMETFLGIDFQVWWFLVFGAVISGYAILDGFDLGAGALHLFLDKEESRRIALNAIGPVWDGNEVWLVIGGGALFAGFPIAYAAIFSAFYIPFMVFIVGLIWRGVAIEFRSKEPGIWWRKIWDIIYSFSSLTISISLGLMLGNVALGIPLNKYQEYEGTGMEFLNVFSVFVSITTVALFMMHGAIFLAMKTENRLYAKLSILARRFTIFFVVSFGITSMYTLLYIPHLSDQLKLNPALFLLPVGMFIAIANIPRQIKRQQFGYAFISSSLTIAFLLVLVSFEVFPLLLRASNDTSLSLTIYNSSSSPSTMKTLLLIAAIGTPLIGIYSTFVFWTFKGKVEMDEMSY